MKKIIFFTFFCLANICLFNLKSFAQPCVITSSTGVGDICADGVSTITFTASGSCGTGTKTWAISGTPGTVATLSGATATTVVATSVSGGVGSRTIIYRDNGAMVATFNITGRALPAPGSITPSGTPSVCAGSTLGFSNTTAGPGTIVWTESSGGADATIDASTGVLTGGAGSAGGVSVTVTSTVTNVYGCVDIATQNVTIYSLPVVTLTGASPMCVTATQTLGGSPSGGSYGTTTPSLTNINSSSGLMSPISDGAAVMTYQYTDPSTNCTNTDNLPVTIDESPTNPGTLSGTLFTWPTATTTLSSTMAGGTWSSGTPGVATITGGGGVVTGVTPGTSVMTYSRTTTCGSNSANVTVTVNSYPAMPTNTRNTLGAFSGITDINTACIYASNSLTGAVAGRTFIAGFALWDGSTPYIEVRDLTSTATVYSLSVTDLTAAPISAPDIVICNGAGTPADKYNVAVAYAASGSVYVDVFEFDMASTPPGFTSTTPIATYSHTVGAGPVRIDGIGDYNTTAMMTTGYPYYQWAAVAWEELSTGVVYAAEIDLQGAGGGMVAHTIDYGHSPDVAGVIRLNAGTQENWAIVTYQEPSLGGKIYVSEQNFTTNTLTAQALTFDGTLSGQTIIPRIDANDNEATNDPTTGDAYLRVVAAVNNGSNTEIRAYDNTIGYPTYWAISNVVSLPVSYSPVPSTYNHFSPSVAMVGPANTGFDGTAFMTTHFMTDGTNDVVFAEAAEVTAPTVLYSGAYHWVSQDPPLATPPSNHASSCAPTCNYIDEGVLVAWQYDNGSGTSTEEIYYDIGTGAYSFKQPGAHGPQTAMANGWQLYPNPATNELTISNATGVGGNYSITDILGRTQRSGIIAGSATEVNVSRLAPGTYIFKINGLNGKNEVKKFVKQ